MPVPASAPTRLATLLMLRNAYNVAAFMTDIYLIRLLQHFHWNRYSILWVLCTHYQTQYFNSFVRLLSSNHLLSGLPIKTFYVTKMFQYLPIFKGEAGTTIISDKVILTYDSAASSVPLESVRILSTSLL